MNRYLFRGKRVDNGEWVEGNVFQPNQMVSGVYICPSTTLCDFMPDLEDGESTKDYKYNGCALGHFHEVIPETVGQCTSFTTSTQENRSVFEGDKVELKIYDYYSNNQINLFPVDGEDFTVFKGIVLWDRDAWVVQEQKQNCCIPFCDIYGDEITEMEIIGNKWENANEARCNYLSNIHENN